jgi:hypothetical protein
MVFMYAIMQPDGKAYMDEGCVSLDRKALDADVSSLNGDAGLTVENGYRVVALHLPASTQMMLRRREARKKAAVAPESQRKKEA